jgi:hypothetical protein
MMIRILGIAKSPSLTEHIDCDALNEFAVMGCFAVERAFSKTVRPRIKNRRMRGR